MSRRTSVKPMVPLLFPSVPLHSTPTQAKVRPPCIPFFRDPGHTVPTRRLYRHLLRATYRFNLESNDTAKPDSDIVQRSNPIRGEAERGLQGYRMRIIRTWRKARQWTSLSKTSEFLSAQSELLRQLSSIQSLSHPELEALLSQDRSLLLTHLRRLARLSHPAPVPPHPRLTGGFLRPTLFNPPLPRLKPQPLGLSMMIHRRLRARENRMVRWKLWSTYGEDMRAEVGMWKTLGVGAEELAGWRRGSKEMRDGCEVGWGGDQARKGAVYGEGMMKRVERAKERKEAWRREKAKRRKEAEPGKSTT